MENILLVIHVIVALVIVGLIMLQQGKGAEMGASFGSGSSQTVFGAAGSGNFFSRMTAILVTVFFITSFALAMIAQNRVEVDDIPLPVVEEVSEVIEGSDIPVLDEDMDDDSIPMLDESDDNIPVLDQSDETIPQIKGEE